MSIPSWARVGAKVVFVDYTPVPSTEDWASLVPRQIYTIAEISSQTITNGPYAGSYGLSVVEHDCPYRFWAIPRFRPVHTLRSDIRMIKSIVRELPAESRLDRLLEVLNQD